MSSARRNAAREAARLQWTAERYRRRGERHRHLKERAEKLATQLEGLAASLLCRGYQRPTAAARDF